MTQQGRLLGGIAILIFYWFMPNQTTEMNYACVKSYWFKLLLQIMGFQGHDLIGICRWKLSAVQKRPLNFKKSFTHFWNKVLNLEHLYEE